MVGSVTEPRLLPLVAGYAIGLLAHLRCRPDDVESVSKNELAIIFAGIAAALSSAALLVPALSVAMVVAVVACRDRDAPRGGPRRDARRMSLEVELERALDAAARLHPAEARPDAVLPAEPHAGARVYLAAFGGGEDVRYLAIDAEGNAVTDRVLVRDTVTMLALAERADEVSGAVAAEELEGTFATAVELLGAAGLPAERDAADAVRQAVAALAAAAAGPRVATPAYLDRIAACAGSCRERWTSSRR